MHQITSKIEISLIPMFLTANGFEENNRNLNYQKGDSETFSRWDIGIVEISISEIIWSIFLKFNVLHIYWPSNFCQTVR